MRRTTRRVWWSLWLVMMMALPAPAPAPALAQAPAPAPAPAQKSTLSEHEAWAAAFSTNYAVFPEQVYVTANNWEGKLDVYRPNTGGPHPTILMFHASGWWTGSRQGHVLRAMPWLDMGWAVVNVSYRFTAISPAPAAVEDGRCALRWVIGHAKDHNFDLARIVVTGESAGGHLALMSGILPQGSDLDRQCANDEAVPVRVAAILNWFGPTDIADMLEGPNRLPSVVRWIGGAPNRAERARQVSPLTYVRAGLPPVLTVHGDADPIVPYSHAIRLRDALTQAHVPNELVTIPGGKHGNFTAEEMVSTYGIIKRFLGQHGLLDASPSVGPAATPHP